MTMSYVPLPAVDGVVADFTIWRDHRGRWVAHEARGLVGGLFVSREAAMRFVRHAGVDNPKHIHVVLAAETTDR